MEFEVVAEHLAFPEGPVVMPDGSIIVVEIAGGRLTRIAPSGKKNVITELGGGPNGAAIGPDGKCYVCNNGGFTWHKDASGFLRPTGRAEDYSSGRIEQVDMGAAEFHAAGNAWASALVVAAKAEHVAIAGQHAAENVGVAPR